MPIHPYDKWDLEDANRFILSGQFENARPILAKLNSAYPGGEPEILSALSKCEIAAETQIYLSPTTQPLSSKPYSYPQIGSTSQNFSEQSPYYSSTPNSVSATSASPNNSWPTTYPAVQTQVNPNLYGPSSQPGYQQQAFGQESNYDYNMRQQLLLSNMRQESKRNSKPNKPWYFSAPVMLLTFLFLTPLWVILVWCDKHHSVAVKVVAGIIFGFYAIFIYNTFVVNLRESTYESITRSTSSISTTSTATPTSNYSAVYSTVAPTIAVSESSTSTSTSKVIQTIDSTATPVPTSFPTATPQTAIFYPTDTPLSQSSSSTTTGGNDKICNYKAVQANVSNAFFNDFVSTFEQGHAASAKDWKYEFYTSEEDADSLIQTCNKVFLSNGARLVSPLVSLDGTKALSGGVYSKDSIQFALVAELMPKAFIEYNPTYTASKTFVYIVEGTNVQAAYPDVNSTARPPTATPTRPPTPTPTKKASNNSNINIYKTQAPAGNFKAQNSEVSISVNLKYARTIGDQQANSNSKFVIFNVSVQNNTNDTVLVSPLDFTLEDIDGATVSYDNNTFLLANVLPTLTLQPGKFVSGQVAFLVTTDFIPGRLVFNNIFNEDLAVTIIASL